MFGQWNHFGAYAKEKLPYAIERYTNEVARLSRVLNHRLEESPWLAGDECSMADIITFPWIRNAVQSPPRFTGRGTIDLAEYPAMKRWYDEMTVRPAVQRGLAVLAEGPGSKADYRCRAREHVRRHPVRSTLGPAMGPAPTIETRLKEAARGLVFEV